MSSISSHIAASVSQGLVQQGQVARKKDAVENRDQLAAEKLREEYEKHVRAVEDSAQIDQHRQRIHEQDHPPDQDSPRQKQDQSDDGDGTHIDVTV